MEKIYIGTLGTSSATLKDSIITYLKDSYAVTDVDLIRGKDEKSGALVAQAVLKDSSIRGIILCGNGYGVAKDASIHQDITAINCVTVSQAISGRINNNANILAMGSKMVTEIVAKDIVSAFLNTDPETLSSTIYRNQI